MGSVVVTSAVAIFAAQGMHAQQPPAFRAAIELVSLTVTATDAGKRHLPDLTRDEFLVVEDGVPQEITFFAKTGVPLASALLIDSSASMEYGLAAAQDAAIGFIRQIAPADLAMVIDFDSHVKTAQGLTGDRALLERAIRMSNAGGSTVLYDAVYIALRELGRVTRAEDGGTLRHAMIVLSDGEDTSSIMGFDDLLDVAKRSDTVIYTIGLGSREPPGTRSRDGSWVLRQLALQTGGRPFFTPSSAELPAVYADIREELSSQYVIGYESNSRKRDGKWRTISVRVNRSGVNVRTRPGYYAPAK